MKNIHILPTDKPSRLFIDIDDNKLKLTIPIGGEHMMNQNIYITSNEEIKEGDYILIHGHYQYGKHVTKVRKITGTYEVIEGGNHSKKVCQKIILTTDQDLIKDGVQAIDDEFLEWFIKNPSCEEVEVINGSFNLNPTETMLLRENYVPENTFDTYKISIPKEEPVLR